MAFMYVTEQGAKVTKHNAHVRVEKEGELITDRVMKEIDALVLFGRVQVTTEALVALLAAGADIAFCTRNGHFKGRAVSATGKNATLRSRQYAWFQDEARRFAMAKRYVAAKIQNGIDVLDAYNKNGRSGFVFDQRDRLHAIRDAVLHTCSNSEALRGHEGSAARLYFDGFGRCLRHARTFPGRIFHPSTDPVNALLSFGYSFVARELQAVLDALGLDPYIGFYHTLTYGRASLSLDLMEEFRHPFVDRLVLRIFNKKMLGDDDFETGDKGQVYLKKESLKIFIRHYEEWAHSVNRTFSDSGEVSWRQAMWKQGERLRHCIEYDKEYTPFSWKNVAEKPADNKEVVPA
jgi:CRISPR-associated protein Cas1